jgi:hypothetical protein
MIVYLYSWLLGLVVALAMQCDSAQPGNVSLSRFIHDPVSGVRRTSLPRTPMNSVGGAVGLQLPTASWRPSAHKATMSPIWSSFGEGRGKGLAPGGARGGCRSRPARDLLRSSGCRHPAPLLVHHGLRHELFGPFPVLVGRPRDRPDRGDRELLAAGPGARCQRGHLTKTALLSAVGFCAFVVFVFTLVPLALMALVATPVVGSLVAVREERPLAVRLGRATVVAAVAMYCASLLAWWAYGAEDWPYSLAPLIVASSSWAVVPAIVALLRHGCV